MANNLELELQHIGLSGREAKVYLAALELGPSPVQKIAQRAGIPRATVYLVLDDLKSKGFVTTYDEGKKTFFVAESPEKLGDLIDRREDELKKQRAAINDLIPELLSRGQFSPNERSVVKFYEGSNALKSLIRDNFKHVSNGEALGIFSHDDAEGILKKMNISWDDVSDWRKRKKVKRRAIYTYRREAPAKDYYDKNAKYIPYKEFPCTADITITGNRVAFAPYNEPIRAIAIEDEATAKTMRAIFEVLWQRL